jgi:hypothetical protein
VGAYTDLAAANPDLKEFYDDQRVTFLAYADNPALAMIPKDPETGGKYYPVPIMYETSQGRSSTFANAQGNQTPILLAEFLVTRKSDYSITTIDNQTLEAALSDKGAFMKLATGVIDAAMRAASISAASSLFRSGTGSIGQVSTISTGVITLTNFADVTQFAVNQTLQANSTDGGTPRAALGYVINRSVRNGTITVSTTSGGTAGSPTSWAANDFLLVQGDLNSKPSGFAAWLPLTDPSSASDNFYGVNRGVDYRLFGVNYDGSGQPIEEAVIDHTMLLGREGANPDHLITNFGSYAAFIKALGTRREYIDVEGPADVGFRGISIDGATGPLKCFADRSCQVQTGYTLTMKHWKLISLGDVPKIIRYKDGNEFLRVYNADAAEARAGGYFNIFTDAPAWSGQVKFSS